MMPRGSIKMSAQHITVESHVGDFINVGTRRKFYRQPNRRMLYILLFFSVALFIFYTFCWNDNVTTSLIALNGGNVGKAGGSGVQQNETLAERLEREIRVLCWIMTTPEYHKTRAVHVLHTWGKRCNKIVFISSKSDDELDTIVLEKHDTYNVLWGKTKAALKYIHEHLIADYDWVMKADDDTYVFVENLRYMLYPYSTNWPIYFGFKFKLLNANNKTNAYMSGGSGYVLSREALRRFVVDGITNPEKCRQEDDNPEDYELGRCLLNVGVVSGDSRDDKLKNRFFPFAPFEGLISSYNGMDFWYYKYAFYNPRACIDCLSEYPVAFHYANPSELYAYDFLNYEFETFGLTQKNDEILPEKLTWNELIIPPSDNQLNN